MNRIIERDRSVIPACDVPLEVFGQIVGATGDIEGVGAYKVGVSFLAEGLKAVVDVAKDHTDKPIIYDHQKAGTDIHESTPEKFMDSMLRAGINAVILFPQAGPVTQYEWTRAAQERELGVIVGGEMTHPRFLAGDTNTNGKKNYSELFQDLGIDADLGGYIRDSAPDDIYKLATLMGVTDFVVPGNKPDRIRHHKAEIEYVARVERLKQSEPTFYSPGLVAQGGVLSEGAEAAGKKFHAIVGRGVYWNKEEKRPNTMEEMRAATLDLTSKL